MSTGGHRRRRRRRRTRWPEFIKNPQLERSNEQNPDPRPFSTRTQPKRRKDKETFRIFVRFTENDRSSLGTATSPLAVLKPQVLGGAGDGTGPGSC
ncbi:hypothetical protein V6Z11_A08G206500 [Gossypium hirsutum]